MKVAKSFRFDTDSIQILQTLERQLQRKQTDLVEEGIRMVMEKYQYHPLQSCIGSLNEQESDELLGVVFGDRQNKSFDLSL
jgi:hypothetical protein